MVPYILSVANVRPWEKYHHLMPNYRDVTTYFYAFHVHVGRFKRFTFSLEYSP